MVSMRKARSQRAILSLSPAGGAQGHKAFEQMTLREKVLVTHRERHPPAVLRLRDDRPHVAENRSDLDTAFGGERLIEFEHRLFVTGARGDGEVIGGKHSSMKRTTKSLD